MHQQQAKAAEPSEEQQAAQGGGRVIPLFRGRQECQQPLVTLANGAWKKLDVARRFAVSSRTVERWMQQEGLPAEKPFGTRGPVRFDPRKVEAWWIAKCQNGGRGSLAAGAGFIMLRGLGLC